MGRHDKLPIHEQVTERHITEGELKRALERLKAEKAPGLNGVTAKMLKVAADDHSEEIFRVLGCIYEEVKYPEVWSSY